MVHATAGHLFFDDTVGGWVKARDLNPGDRLRTGDGATATVASTTVVPGSGDMWDLTIQGLHDFYIQTTNDNAGDGGSVGGGEGAGGVVAVDPAQTTILTHNCPIAGGDDAKSVDIQGARFAQKSFSESFSEDGTLSGRTIDDVASALRSGEMSPQDVPVDVISRDDNTLILNTRSSQALIRGGIPRSSWSLVDRTGQAEFEERLSGQLARNGLTSFGTDLP